MDAVPAAGLAPVVPNRPARPSAEAVVEHSRQRCAHEHRLCAETGAAPVIRTQAELRALREPLEPLLTLAHEALDELHALVRANGYSVLLAAPDGTIIDQRCASASRRALAAQGTCPGGLWSEAAAGTNGIGTCLLAQQALTVHRGQHYRRGHAHMSCSSAPILDADGRLEAVLTLASHAGAASDSTHGLALSLAAHWAQRIEARRFRERHRQAWVLRLQASDVASDDDPAAVGGLLAFDDDGGLLQADAHARRMLERMVVAVRPGLPIRACFEGLPERLPRGLALSLRLRARSDLREWIGRLTPPLARMPLPQDADAATVASPAPPARGGLAPRAQRAVLAHIAAHLDREIRVETLAGIAGLSPKHFSRVFQHSLGCAPHRYLMQQRVRRAAELLASTRQPLSDIAQATGFADQSHMTRCFLRELGTSPSRYRRTAADERAR